jgi:hypothetical protein
MLASMACSGDQSSGKSAGNGNNVPEGKHWQVTLDGATPHEAETLIRQYVAGKLTLMGTGGPGLSGVILIIPMATENETGTFETGVEITLPGISDLGTCKHEADSSTSSVTVNITTNSDELFLSTFSFTDIDCKKGAGKVSGSGTITEKK